VTVINKNRIERSAVIRWVSADPTKTVAVIDFCQVPASKCEWHTREQITLGTPLKQIERLNAGPFTLLGFGLDYDGSILNFRSGRLTPLDQCPGNVHLRLFAPSDPSQSEQLLLSQVTGDHDFSSAHPAMQAVNLRVGKMSMNFSYCR
jgi:hypothetical protein